MKTSRQVHRYIVVGGDYGDSAHLHVVAASEEQAIAEYYKYFNDKVAGWRKPHATNLSENPAMEQFWRGYMWGSFTKGY